MQLDAELEEEGLAVPLAVVDDLRESMTKNEDSE
jgi:hypothetical protein